MNAQIPLSPTSIAESAEHDYHQDGTHEVVADVAYKRCALVNVVFYGVAGLKDREWVLIDTGVMGTVNLIKRAARERYGNGSRPAAIILTHGHFDHIGGLRELSEEWNAPIYVHPLEVPYLDGSAAYPEPDPTVGGGIMPLMAPLFPRGPINVSERLRLLPTDGTVPQMPGWQWVHTPGHTPGHFSLWREADRTLIAGDAFVTTRQESAYAVAVQKPEMHGPPAYFTPDWVSAKASVQHLAALEPERVITGHGRAMEGAEMRAALHELAARFNEVAVPTHGKYVGAPATAVDGSAYPQP